MATSTLLKNIHVFPTLASYESNKASIGEDELALIPGFPKPVSYTILAGEASTTSNFLTNLTFSQPYTDFDALLFCSKSNTVNNWSGINIYPTWFFEQSAEFAKNTGTQGNQNVFLVPIAMGWVSYYVDITPTTWRYYQHYNYLPKVIYGLKF